MIRRILFCTVLLIALIAIPTMVTVAKGPKLPPEKNVTFSGDLEMDPQVMWVDRKGDNLTVAGYPESLILKSNIQVFEGEDVALRINLNETKTNVGKAKMVFYFSVGTSQSDDCETDLVNYYFEGSGTYNYVSETYKITLSEADVYENVFSGRRGKVEQKHLADVSPVNFTMVIDE